MDISLTVQLGTPRRDPVSIPLYIDDSLRLVLTVMDENNLPYSFRAHGYTDAVLKSEADSITGDFISDNQILFFVPSYYFSKAEILKFLTVVESQETKFRTTLIHGNLTFFDPIPK